MPPVGGPRLRLAANLSVHRTREYAPLRTSPLPGRLGWRWASGRAVTSSLAGGAAIQAVATSRLARVLLSGRHPCSEADSWRRPGSPDGAGRVFGHGGGIRSAGLLGRCFGDVVARVSVGMHASQRGTASRPKRSTGRLPTSTKKRKSWVSQTARRRRK